MVETGYEGTELGPVGYFGSAAEARLQLQQHNLELTGAFVGVPLTDSAAADRNVAEIAATMDFLEEAQPLAWKPLLLLSDAWALPDASAARIACAGRIQDNPDVWLSEDGWKELCEQVRRIAETARGRSFEIAFHPHAGSYVETPDEIGRLLDFLDQQTIGWCLDTGHTFFGGGDPLELLGSYGDRLRWIHLKDVHLDVLKELKRERLGIDEGWRRGIFCELGQGGVDVDAVLARVRELGYDSWIVVEQDLAVDPGRPLEIVRRLAQHNRDYLRARGYGDARPDVNIEVGSH
jgi:inosose dehydratase